MKQQIAKPNRRRQGGPATVADTGPSGERLRRFLLGALVAIYVARPLLPSEAPTTVAGDGLPFVVLSLLLAAVWLLAQVVDRRASIHFGLVERAWTSLLAWQAASAYVATQTCYARAAVNTFWEWAGLGIGYLLLRQLLRSDREKRAVIVVMIGLAIVLSLDGIYQYFVENPAVRELYQVDADRMLERARISAPPGSAARQLFEQRLNSTETTATFALANSLAGCLTPWLLMTLAIGWLGRCNAGNSTTAGRLKAGAALIALPIAFCLVLTKSRAGYLAVLAGFALMLFLSRRNSRRTWQVAAVFAAIAVALAVAGFAFGALDREVFSEAMKSLSYRWHYWRGALAIVREHPWFGCGPGNFQDEYTRFKLPESSEVVADPHNFAIEIWATSGTPALMAFIALLIGAAIEWRRTARIERHSGAIDGEGRSASLALRVADEGSHSASLALRVSEEASGRGPLLSPFAGGVAGLWLAFAVGQFTTVGLPWEVLLAGLTVLPAAGFLFYPWIKDGRAPRFVPFVCAWALLVNLLAAGGIGFAGVAGSLWMLLAIGAPRTDDGASVTARCWVIAGLCGATVLLASCYWTAYRPVLGCRGLLAQAEREPVHARQNLLAAAEADRWADEPWRQLAAGDFSLWLKDPAAPSSDWERDQAEVLRRRPHSSAAWLEVAERYFTAYREVADQGRKQGYLSRAVRHFSEAAQLYPSYPLVHAELALALAAAGRPEAKAQAALALKLHEQTPHQDQQLPRELVQTVKELVRTMK